MSKAKAKRFFLLFVALNVLVTSTQSFAATLCRDLMAPQLTKQMALGHLASRKINEEMAAKYPTLAFFISDPENFIKEMRSRFSEQKMRTPSTPYQFDYSEVGMPIFKFASTSLDTKLLELNGKISDISLYRDNGIWTKSLYKKQLQELRTAQRFYTALKADSDAVLTRGNVPYDQTIEYAYFLSRALGHFDARKMSLLTQILLSVDNNIQGYQQLPIEEEYALYQARRFKFFQLSSPVHTFKQVEESFTAAFQNLNSLERIVVPVTENIDRDILYELVPSIIDLEGITYKPIAADGFLRPAGHFLNHDRRHNSIKMIEHLRYLESKNPTEKQMRAIMALQDMWALGLQEAIAKIQDGDLREAVDLTAFNWHHDRGFPYTPSVWLETKKNAVIYALDFTLILSGQGTGFKNVIANTKAADTWLNNFWATRLPEEVKVFQSAN